MFRFCLKRNEISTSRPEWDSITCPFVWRRPRALSHDPALKERSSGFTVPIQELRILAGAGFLTAVCSMDPADAGIAEEACGERIDVDPQPGEIVGLA